MTEAELKLTATYDTLTKATEALVRLADNADKTKAKADSLAVAMNAVAKSTENLNKSFEKAGSKISSSLDDVVKSFSPLNLAVNAATALISAFTLGAIKGMVTGVIEGAASLNNLSKQTGLTVEELSIMKTVANQSGTSMDTVTGAVLKFQKAIATSGRDTSIQSKAFKELGISTADTTKSTEEYLSMAASKLEGLKDGWQKNNIVMALFGKTGTEVNEFLSDYANKGTTAAKITAEQAEAAEHYERTMKKLSATANQYKQLIGLALLPVMSSIADEFLKLVSTTGKLDAESKKLISNEIADWGFNVAKGIAAAIDVGIAFFNVLKGLGIAIGTIVAGVVGLGDVFDDVIHGRFEEASNKIQAQSSAMKDGFGDAWKSVSKDSSLFYDTVVKAEDNYRKGVVKTTEEIKKRQAKSIVDTEVPDKKGPHSFDDRAYIIKAREEIQKLTQETAKFNGVQIQTHRQLLEVKIAAGDYGQVVDQVTGKLIKRAASQDQLNKMRAIEDQHDYAQKVRDEAEAQSKLWDAYNKSNEALAKNIEGILRAAEEHRISVDVLRDKTKTQDDATIAVLEYNKAILQSKVDQLAATEGVEANTTEFVKANAALSEVTAKIKAANSIRGTNIAQTIETETKAILDQLNPNRLLIEQLEKINNLRGKQGGLTDAQANDASGRAKLGALNQQSPQEQLAGQAQGLGFDISGTKLEADARIAEYQRMYDAINVMREAGKISEEEASRFRGQVAVKETEDKIKTTTDTLGAIAILQNSHNKKLAAIGKAAAIAEATILGVVAVQKQLALGNYAAAFAAGITATANVAKIAGVFKEGGYTGNGGTSEPAGVVHGKEFVINADATARNRNLLEAINNGARGYEMGGFVQPMSTGAGSSIQMAGRGSGGGNTQVNHITIESSGGDVDKDRQQGKLISAVMEQKWYEMNDKASRAGGVNNPVSLQF